MKTKGSAISRHSVGRLSFALAIVAAAPAVAKDTPADVEAACAAMMEVPTGTCACIAERSATELSAEQRAFYVAALNGDDAETARLRGSMEPLALLGVVTFMRQSPTGCAG